MGLGILQDTVIVATYIAVPSISCLGGASIEAGLTELRSVSWVTNVAKLACPGFSSKDLLQPSSQGLHRLHKNSARSGLVGV